MNKILILFFFTITVLSNSAFSQQPEDHKSITQQEMLWLYYAQTAHLSKEYFLITELEYRTFVDPLATQQWLIRPHVHRVLSPLSDVGLGISYFELYTNNPSQDPEFVLPEWRLHGEFNSKQVLGRLVLSHRYRLEARWIHKVCEDGLCGGYNFFGRFRYRLQVERKLWEDEKGKSLNLKVNDELMLNLSEKTVYNVFDQNRVYIGLGFRTSATTMLELGYLHLFQQRASGSDYYDRDVLRFTFFHTLDFRKTP